jgi:hypothetical protein
MATLNLKAVNEEQEALPGASFHVVFRGNVLGVGYNTGIVDVKADDKGEVKVAIPLFTDHANITTISGSNISDSTVKINPVDDWVFWLNPFPALIQGVATTTVPVDIPPLVAGGKKEIVQNTEFDPVRVAANKTSNVIKQASDYVSKYLISIIVIVIAAAVGIYALKYIGNPFKSLAKAGKTALKKAKEVVMY